MSPKPTVFYSWQSDLPPKTNRSLIQDALERAAKAIRNDDSIAIDPVIDRDVQGIPGSPEIHAAIMEKIKTAAAAVFDVSCVQSADREHPNPNVLIELGYALGTIGWGRVVLVFNEHYGDITRLPFDIRNRLALKYTMRQEDTPAAARSALSGQLEVQLREILLRVAATQQAPSLVTAAIDALHEGAPGAVAQVRKTLERSTRALIDVHPEPAPSGSRAEPFLKAYASTAPIAAELVTLTRAIIESKHREAFDELLRSLERIAEARVPKGDGAWQPWTFDIQRLLPQELTSAIAAVCLDARRWDFLRQLLQFHFSYRNNNDERSGNVIALLDDSEATVLDELATVRSQGRTAVFGGVLKERYTQPPLAELLAFRALREGEYFLYLATELVAEQSGQIWPPVCLLYHHDDRREIDWVKRTKNLQWLKDVSGAMGLSVAEFKSRYAERWTKVATYFPRAWLSDRLKWILLQPQEMANE